MLLADLLPHPARPSGTWTTGLVALDAVLNGAFARGRTLLVVGSPGEGKSMLASHLAVQVMAAGGRVRLVTPEVDQQSSRSRVLSAWLRIPLSHLWPDVRMSVDDERKLAAARRSDLRLPLDIDAGDGAVWAARADGARGAEVLVVDDAHLVGAEPDLVRPRDGQTRVVVLPRAEVVRDTSAWGPLAQGWAGAADCILEIRLRHLNDSSHLRPGEADARVLYNRYGPCATVRVGFQGHFARFVDIASEPEA